MDNNPKEKMSSSQNFEVNFNDLLIYGPGERRWENMAGKWNR